jgi:hypothetical protein
VIGCRFSSRDYRRKEVSFIPVAVSDDRAAYRYSSAHLIVERGGVVNNHGPVGLLYRHQRTLDGDDSAGNPFVTVKRRIAIRVRYPCIAVPGSASRVQLGRWRVLGAGDQRPARSDAQEEDGQ